MATQLLGVAVPESQQQYGSILTERGENAELNGKLQNKGIQFKFIDFGDANDTYVQPDRKQQALTHKLGRIKVNSVDVLQPTPDSIPMLKVEAILPSDMYDIVIREYAAVAEFNGQEYLHAIGNCARVYVPNPALNGGTSNPVTLEMIFVITSAEPIIEIDPLVIQASREYVNNKDTENLGKVFGSKPVDLVNNLFVTPVNNQYPKLAAFNAIYELADNSAAYTVKSFVQSVGGDCVITLSDDSLLVAKKVEAASLEQVKKQSVVQLNTINANSGILLGTANELISKAFNQHKFIQVNEYPTITENTLFEVIPHQVGEIEVIDLAERSIKFKARSTLSFLSEKQADNNLDISSFNLDITGTKDETEKLKAIALSSKSKRVFGFKGKVRVSETIQFESPESIDFENVEFVVNRDTDNFTDAVVVVGKKDITEVLTTTTIFNEAVNNLGSIPNVNVGDIVSIWNPVDGSWSGYRPAYRQGEYHRVISVNPVIIETPLFDTYPVSSKVFVLSSQKIRVKGKVKVTNKGSYGLLIGVKTFALVDSDLSGLDTEIVEGTHSLVIEKGLNNSGNCMRAFQKSSTTSGLDYGLSVLACQSSKFCGDFHGERHGATYGNSSAIGDAINRDCCISGQITTTGQGQVQAANMHGNVERCGFGGFLQGYNPAGHDSYLLAGTKVVSPINDMSSVQFSEMKSTKHTLNCAEIVMYGSALVRGIIDAGGNAVAFDQNCTMGGTMDFSKVKVIGKSHQRPIVTMRNRGSNVQWSINADGLVNEVPESNMGVSAKSISGSSPINVSLNNSSLWKVRLSLDAATKINGIYQVGEGTASITANGANIQIPVTFEHSFYRFPIIQLIQDEAVVGSSIAQFFAINQRTSGFSISIINMNGSAWNKDATINFKWKAEIN